MSAMADSCVDGVVKEAGASDRDNVVATTARFARRLDGEVQRPQVMTFFYREAGIE